jgi:hypothetical protein
MEGFETGRPLYSTIDRYILICFGKGISQRVRRYYGWKVLVTFITDSVLAWYYIFKAIDSSATSDPIVEEAWDKVVDTIKAIEKEYRA